MTDSEKLILKDLAHLFVDKELDVLLKDLIAKIPAQYGPIVGLVEQAALPAIVAALDAKIDAI